MILTTQLQTGDIVQEGPDAGWIFCAGRDGEPFLVAPKDGGVMKWREAKGFAASDNAGLPTIEQLAAMFEARETGGLKGTFNRTGSEPAGWYWSATQNTSIMVWSQNFNNGYRLRGVKSHQSSVRCVRRLAL